MTQEIDAANLVLGLLKELQTVVVAESDNLGALDTRYS